MAVSDHPIHVILTAFQNLSLLRVDSPLCLTPLVVVEIPVGVMVLRMPKTDSKESLVECRLVI